MRRSIPFLWLVVGLIGLTMTGWPAAWADDPGGNPDLAWGPANPNNANAVYNAGCPQQPDCIKWTDWNGCVTGSSLTLAYFTYNAFELVDPIPFGYCQEGSEYSGRACCYYETRPCYTVILWQGPACGQGGSFDWTIFVRNACPPDPDDPELTGCATS